ncbi:hypothetical protein CW745_04320 [Psychromonas sp. psych-6C06]|uniref:flavin reductase family protein n=1 Tax=Psychromonas sp. psych-6C06 TaxID=2058089 RepID=UPI000C31C495|nr:flavin reductase [Psychromonas sp. psych-6C06]PKF62654.1 hypothetical protein CW745_04320 [Psychromonas sp. psych-6C06]
MPERFRAHFINSLSGFKSANLIATQDKDGNTNLAIISSVVHLGTNPALVGFVMRPDNNARHTLNNIIATKSYTINQVSQPFYQQAHQTSARYGKYESEFSHCNLSTNYIDNIEAPFVEQSQLKYAVNLKQIIPIELNNTQFIIGQIEHVICADEAIQDDGYIDIESLQTVSVSGIDSYHKNQRLNRLSYAKKGVENKPLLVNGATYIGGKSDESNN